MTSLTIHSTRRCYALPRLLFAFEEAAAPYEVVVHDDGYFERVHGRMGPLLEDGDLRLFETNAMLRHVARTRAPGVLWPSEPDAAAAAEAWMDFMLTAFRTALLACVSEQQHAMDELRRVLRVIEARLVDRAWLCDTFGVADLAFAGLLLVPTVSGEAMRELPRAAAWLNAMGARPAWRRAQAACLRLRDGRSAA